MLSECSRVSWNYGVLGITRRNTAEARVLIIRNREATQSPSTAGIKHGAVWGNALSLEESLTQPDLNMAPHVTPARTRGKWWDDKNDGFPQIRSYHILHCKSSENCFGFPQASLSSKDSVVAYRESIISSINGFITIPNPFKGFSVPVLTYRARQNGST